MQTLKPYHFGHGAAGLKSCTDTKQKNARCRPCHLCLLRCSHRLHVNAVVAHTTCLLPSPEIARSTIKLANTLMRGLNRNVAHVRTVFDHQEAEIACAFSHRQTGDKVIQFVLQS
jgi:DUF1680 family protein